MFGDKQMAAMPPELSNVFGGVKKAVGDRLSLLGSAFGASADPNPQRLAGPDNQTPAPKPRSLLNMIGVGQ